MTWFNKLPRLVQVILLLIPGINWVVELIVRIESIIKKPGLMNILVFILFFLTGYVLAWLDLIWCLLFKHLLFQ